MEGQELQNEQWQTFINNIIEEAGQIEIKDMEQLVNFVKLSHVASVKTLNVLQTLEQNDTILVNNDQTLNQSIMQHEHSLSNLSQVTEALLGRVEQIGKNMVATDSQVEKQGRKLSKVWKLVILLISVLLFGSLAYLSAVLGEFWRNIILSSVVGLALTYAIGIIIKSWNEN